MEEKDYDSCGPYVHEELSRLIPDPDLNITSMVSSDRSPQGLLSLLQHLTQANS